MLIELLIKISRPPNSHALRLPTLFSSGWKSLHMVRGRAFRQKKRWNVVRIGDLEPWRRRAGTFILPCCKEEETLVRSTEIPSEIRALVLV